MPQPVMQERIAYLETVGEDTIMEMVEGGLYLNQIAEQLDPGNSVGISKSVLSRWLSGKVKRNTRRMFPLPDGTTEERAPETPEQAAQRGARYQEARVLWAEAIVEGAGQKLMEETNDKMAALRKAQGEFAFRIAGIFDKRFQEQKGAQVAVQVNIDSGDSHLNALMRRRVRFEVIPEVQPQIQIEGQDADTTDHAIVGSSQ